MVEDLRAQAQILAPSIPGLNDLEHLSAVSQPQSPHLKAGYNDNVLFRTTARLSRGAACKALSIKKAVNGGYNCVTMPTRERLLDTRLLSLRSSWDADPGLSVLLLLLHTALSCLPQVCASSSGAAVSQKQLTAKRAHCPWSLLFKSYIINQGPGCDTQLQSAT